MIEPRYDHQEKSFQKGLTCPIFFDTSDPGTGKTRVQLDIVQHRIHHDNAKATLALAPKTLLYPAWADDVKKFTPDLKISVATAPNRDKSFIKPADLYITNSDAATWLAKQSASFFERFDTLIMDEITYFKNPTSARSVAMAEIAKYFPRRSGLTGTPIPNHITDIWHPLFLLDDGERLGDSFWAFRNTTCSPLALNIPGQPYAKKWIPHKGIEYAVANLFADINIRHRFEDCIDIPPTQITEINYDLNPKTFKAYKELERTAVLAMQEGFILGLNKAALMGKLFQACAGNIYTQTSETAYLDNQRVQILYDLVRDRDHTVIFYQWQHQRDAILKYFKAKGITTCILDGSAKKRGETTRRFQNGLYRVLLAHPKTAGYGLTLTRACCWIWASLTWNLEHFLQGNRRVARAGQERRTEQIIIRANNTVEQKVYNRLTAKNATQESILNILEELQ